MTSTRSERMSHVDRAWLEMDTPVNPMIVAGMLELSGIATPARWAREMARRLLRFPRFSQRADDTSAPPAWMPATADLGYHVRVKRLPRDHRPSFSAADEDQRLREAIAAEMDGELDRGRPLWRVTLFPRGRGRFLVLFRAHHALADGVALLRLLMDCTDTALRKGAQIAAPRAAPARHDGPIGGLIDALESANSALVSLRDAALDDLRHPGHLAAQWREARAAASAVHRVFTLPQDNPREMRPPLSGHRRIAWVSGLPLAGVRKVARQFSVKVNDVFMAVLAGALGDVLRAHGAGMLDTQNLRASVPVNLRNGGDDGPGNQFGLVLVDLPIAIQDPVRSLRVVAERMRALKESSEARAVLGSLALVGRLPVELEKKLIGFISDKSAAVISNLPGPRRRVRLAGARIDDVVFWPPRAGGIGLGVSLFSYAGRYSVGVSADTAVLPNPQALLDAFERELRELRALARFEAVQHAA